MTAKVVQQIVARFDAVPFSLTGFMLLLPHTQLLQPGSKTLQQSKLSSSSCQDIGAHWSQVRGSKNETLLLGLCMLTPKWEQGYRSSSEQLKQKHRPRNYWITTLHGILLWILILLWKLLFKALLVLYEKGREKYKNCARIAEQLSELKCSVWWK